MTFHRYLNYMSSHTGNNHYLPRPALAIVANCLLDSAVATLDIDGLLRGELRKTDARQREHGFENLGHCLVS